MANRTLWEEGHQPARRVELGVAAALLSAILLSLAFGDRIGLVFDVVLVLSCVVAALLVRPQDFFSVGVLPPLALSASVLLLVLTDRGAVAQSDDGVFQAFVSGLAHHAQALAIGYGLTLGLLALRQVAYRNQGRLRRPHQTKEAVSPQTPDLESATSVAR